jgi:glucokinase-like ROK family protein
MPALIDKPKITAIIEFVVGCVKQTLIKIVYWTAMKISEQALVRELNTSTVMDAIRLHAPISRAEIAAYTGLNRSTVSHIANELIDRGYVHETMRQDPKIGRPGMLLQFNPSGGFAIGVEIGVDFLSVLLTNFTAEILWQRWEPTPLKADRFQIMEQAENLISQAMDHGEATGLRSLGIGVGLPGLVDERTGRLVFAPNLKWADIPIRMLWMTRFNVPVYVDNEANIAAMGEYFYGVAHDVENFIYLKTGVGLGAGIMINGRLFKGAHGFAGEVGHTSLYGDGPDCGCGRRGCWETYVSTGAIVERALCNLSSLPAPYLSEHLPSNYDGLSYELLIQAAQMGDPAAIHTFEETALHLGAGVTNLVNTFNPELVVLGGALSQASAWLTPTIEHLLQECALPPLRSRTRLEVSRQGEHACVLGAVAYVLDNVLHETMNNMG